MINKILISFILLTPGVMLCRADIHPHQVAVLINENSPESRLIGRYYQEMRNIPPKNMIFLRTQTSDTIFHNHFRLEIESRVKETLSLAENYAIKYLVTTKGLPILVLDSVAETSSPTGPYETNTASLESDLMNALNGFNLYSGWNRRLSPSQKKSTKIELTVLRLDGPGIVEIKNLLSHGMKAEKEGLKGSFIIDARGLPTKPIYDNQYDQSLRLLARLLTGKLPDVSVIYDSTARQMSEPDYAGAALYIGWPGSFKKKAGLLAPGALGFCLEPTLAGRFPDNSKSFSMSTQVAIGTSHTLGTIHPSVITVFPVPHHYFALLLSGKYALGEVIQKTAPHSSWMVSYIGDPMYQPFKTNPQLDSLDMEYLLNTRLDE
ncbi:MAG: TIGR03790 family protein [Fibrobacteria bacterium]|nr:TIGR03790 family protein [Fibrobacteria bacterium]